MAANYGPCISPQHGALLEASGITVDHAQSRGYQSRRDVLEIPLLRKDGSVWGRQDRFDNPGTDLRYKTPARQRMGIDVPPGVGPLLDDPKIELWITEGSRKADSAVCNAGLACVALLGVDGWRGTNAQGGKTALADWADIALNGRSVVIAYDSDVMVKETVQQALAGLAGFLEYKGATVRYCNLPPAADGSKTGLDDYLAAGHTLAELRQLVGPEPPGDPDDLVRALLPRLDWRELWSADPGVEWILFPLLPARRLVALFSPPAAGKSLLLLEVAAALSTGRKVLEQTPVRRYRVLYIDFENDPIGDILERLDGMGYGPDDLDHLDYLSFPTLAHLDSARGGAELMAAIKAYGSEIVVIDTISRVVGGEENSNDTWLDFYRHTGLKIKQASVALIRLDHTGKDETKGMRGGSAKSSDVDAAWLLTKVTEDRRRLENVKARFPLDTKSLNLIMREDPLRHRVENLSATDAREAKILHIMELADAARLAPDVGWRELRPLGKQHKLKGRNDLYAEAARRRKILVPAPRSQQTDNADTGTPEPTGTEDPETVDSEGKNPVPSHGVPPGTTNQSRPVPVFPPIRGNRGTAGTTDPEPKAERQPRQPRTHDTTAPCPTCNQPITEPNNTCSASRFHGKNQP
jgi:hypothetical protein